MIDPVIFTIPGLNWWERAGRELLEVDPRRFVRLLQIAQQLVNAHADPMSEPLAPDACAPAEESE